MTEQEKLRLATEALKDITSCLASLQRLGRMPKDQALQMFEDTYETIAKICVAAQHKITNGNKGVH